MNSRSTQRFRAVPARTAVGAWAVRVAAFPAIPAPSGLALALAACLVLLGGCATPAELGRLERLPEGTLPPSKEVGPPVNIQPAPPRAVYRDPAHVDPWGPGYQGWPGGYGPGCFDPFFCRPGWGAPSGGFYRGIPGGRSGFGLQLRLF